MENCIATERKVEASVVESPCNGPDVDNLNELEAIEASLAQLADDDDPLSLLPSSSFEIRFVYTPTALYAL